jgi:hypothetical protein
MDPIAPEEKVGSMSPAAESLADGGGRRTGDGVTAFVVTSAKHLTDVDGSCFRRRQVLDEYVIVFFLFFCFCF